APYGTSRERSRTHSGRMQIDRSVDWVQLSGAFNVNTLALSGVPGASFSARAVGQPADDWKKELVLEFYCSRNIRFATHVYITLPIIIHNYLRRCASFPGDGPRRSEEHTSELQSRVDLVCR